MGFHGNRSYYIVSLFSLALAASTGVLLRFGMVMGMPTWASDFSSIRHAHSHLMYFGWVTVGLMALIWHFLPSLTGRALPKGIGIQMAASALLALLSFPAFWSNGYGRTQIGSAELPLGSIAAGLNGMVWMLFAALYVRATWRLPERPLPVQLWDWAITLLVLAFGGALGLVGLVFADSMSNIFLQQFFLHLFLDIFAVGWFNLALLGLLWAWIGRTDPLPSWLPTQSLGMLVVPTFILGMSPILPTEWMFWLAALANLLVALLLAWHLALLWQRRTHLPPLVRFGMLILAVHIASAFVVAWPGFWRWSAGTQLRVFFLHNLLLGWVSSALLGILLAVCLRLLRGAERTMMAIWIGGVGVMLLALLGVGFIQFVPINAATLLWIAAWSTIAPALVALWALGKLLVARIPAHKGR